MQEGGSSIQHALPNPNPQEQPHDGVVSFSREPPPTLLRINADNQDKRAICLFWIIFFVIIIVISIASSFCKILGLFLVPKGTFRIENKQQVRGTNLEGCDNPNFFDNQSILQCGNATDKKIGGLMLNLRRQNQFVVLFWKLLLIDSTKQMTKQNQTTIKVNYTAYKLKQTQKDGKLAYKIEQKDEVNDQNGKSLEQNLNLTLYYSKQFKIFAQDGKTLKGYSVPVSVLRNFVEQSHIVIIQIPQTFDGHTNINQIRPQILVVNPQFTKYSLIIRYLFFAFSLVACVIYIFRLCKIPASQRIIEQKLIAVLSVLLVFFNDPFYPITVMYPNKASSYFSVFFVINFVIFLIFFWIIFLDRMYHEDGQKQTQLIEKKRLIYIIITYIIVLVLYTLVAMDHIEGMPIVQTEQLTSRKYIGLELFAILAIVLGFAYIIFNYIRLCMKVDTLLWRNQLFLFFSVFFIFMTLALFFVNGFQINSYAGNRILLLFTTMNMYTFYMQYMYSISSEERDRVNRGQIEYGGQGLLEVRSGEGDCVDLEFEDMSVGGGGGKGVTEEKLGEFVDRNRREGLLREKEREDGDMYSPKYGDDYQKDLKYKAQPKKQLIQDDKQTDFFKDDAKNQEEEDPRIVKKEENNKKKDQFQQFSLDD